MLVGTGVKEEPLKESQVPQHKKVSPSAVLYGRCDVHIGVRLLFSLFSVELGLEDLSPPTALTNLIPIWVRGHCLQSGCSQTTDTTCCSRFNLCLFKSQNKNSFC